MTSAQQLARLADEVMSLPTRAERVQAIERLPAGLRERVRAVVEARWRKGDRPSPVRAGVGGAGA